MQPSDINVIPSYPTKSATWRAWIHRMPGLLDQPRVVNIILCLILVCAAWFRFHGLAWDEGRHLHPDERFLSTVTNDLKWPDSLEGYFDPNVSTLSPYTLPNMGLFVYGTLPIYVVKWAAIVLDQNNYNKITYIGRTLSGLFDLSAIFFLFLIGKRLYGSKVGLLGAALLSLSVLNIQLSHFYAVDTFANFFIVSTIYFLLRAASSGRWLNYAITGILFGLGLSSKVSTLTLAVPILVACAFDMYQRTRAGDARAAFEHVLVRLLTVFFVAAVTFRVAQPISFSGPGFLNWSLNPLWWQDIIEQQKIVSGTVDLPWVQQWTSRSVAFPLNNILLWGMGVPLGVASFAGLVLAAYELIRHRKLVHLLPVTYVVVTFVYHAITFVKFMRYFFPIYPFLALFAAYLLTWLWRHIPAPAEYAAPAGEPPAGKKRFERLVRDARLSPGLVICTAAVVAGGTLLYALAFSTIYDRPNSRIAASRWLYNNIPAGSTLANEHWDDWLPIGGLDGKTAYGDRGMFKSVEMKNYEDDTPAKLDQTVANLTQADYLVLSSNRLYGSIPRLPMRYPLMSRYYTMLFSGALGFEQIAEFTSYPTFLGISIPDQAAEESFTVYDHARVQIFKKTAAFDPQKVRAQLGEGIQWKSVIHMTPFQASTAPTGLMLSPTEQVLYQKASAGSSREVSAGNWGSHAPVLAWFLVLQLFALLALPITLTTFSHLADRGYIFSKAAGLLLVGWGAWIVASLRIAPFTWWMILLVAGLLAAVAFFLAWQQWDMLRSFLKTHWRTILIEEALFWVFFAILLGIRMQNPDMWHPGMGGEKPMDLAYLTAIVHTPYFPAYDPWFAGGYINYYYFGFVLVATLVHLTGIVPDIAYNLALPTLFAMTAMGGFAVALNLAEGMQNRGLPERPGRFVTLRALLLAGLCGALFVAVIGNLAQVQLIWNGLRDLSAIKTQGGATVLTSLAQVFDGVSRWMVDHKLPTVHTNWWYWNATRVIPPAKGEAGPINEMPFFTFLFGDLHAHMMALPYTLLALGLAINFIRGAFSKEENPGHWWRSPSEVWTLGLLALTTGALWPTNTWDFPTYTLLAFGALACREYARRCRVDLPGVWAVLWRIGLVVIAGRLLFLPFHHFYAGSNLGVALWKGSQTALKPYLLIHGFFLFVIGSYLMSDFLFTPGHNALVRGIRRGARRRLLFLHLPAEYDEGAPDTPGYHLAVDISRVALVLVLVVLLFRPVIGLALGLSLLTCLLLFSARPDPVRQFLRFMILVGLMLTVLVEVVVLQGDVGRMNTVFKFYLQVWVLWAVVSAAVLPELAARLKSEQPDLPPQPIPDLQEGSAWTPEVAAQFEALRRKPLRQTWAQRWWWGFGLLLAACFLYPLTAAPAKTGDRFKDSHSITLDGSAYLHTSVYFDDKRPVQLDWDRQAFDWLRQNVAGTPTIVEASTPIYRWGARVSIHTGLPTVIGWDWHQKQQRGILPARVIDQRIQDVKTIFTSTDLEQTRALLKQYGVQYVYVGPLEHLYYAGDGLQKFDRAGEGWKLVYQNEQVKIYQVN